METGEITHDDKGQIKAVSEIKPCVLIVDDEPQGIRLLSLMLDSLGYEHASASNGMECLKMIDECCPDIILMDLYMPVMDGIEATRRIKSNPETQRIPIVILTSAGDPASKSKCLEAGATLFLKKPFEPAELMAKLKNLIKLRDYEETNVRNKILQEQRDILEEKNLELQNAYNQLKSAQSIMLHQEKMASLGQLAAGLAHEINNPIGFIASNLNTLERYINSIKEIMQIYRAKSHGDREVEEAYRKMKIDFKLQDISELIEQSRSGADRIRRIIENLKGFSHIDEAEMRDVDFKEEIERTLNVLSHEIALRSAQVISRFGDIPKYYCSAGLIGQVFVNLIMNALQSRERGVTITITTLEKDGNIIISIEDDGVGMSEDIKNRIFEPFFTTKDVNKGTGMGLTVAYDIVSSMGGTIEIQSQPGEAASSRSRSRLRAY